MFYLDIHQHKRQLTVNLRNGQLGIMPRSLEKEDNEHEVS